jgi:hypothetical protein
MNPFWLFHTEFIQIHDYEMSQRIFKSEQRIVLNKCYK